MKRKRAFACAVSIAFAGGAFAAQQASKVQVLRVGSPSSNSLNDCLPGGASVHPGAVTTIELEARRVARGSAIPGTVRLLAIQDFRLADGVNPPVVFRYDRNSAPARFRVRVSDALAVGSGRHRLEFRAVDNMGVASESFACGVGVESPLFSVRDLRIGAPDASGTRLIHFTARNERNMELPDLPWQVSVAGSSGLAPVSPPVVIRRGIAGVPPNGSTDVAVRWSSQNRRGQAGRVLVTVTLDPQNVLRENVTADDNSVSVFFHPWMSTQELDPVKAAAAGATFVHNIEGNSGCNRLGVGNWRDANWDVWSHVPRATGVLFVADCTGSSAFPVFGPNTGGKANPEAYKGFTLKNGWTIRSATLVSVDRVRGDFRWVSAPKIGTNDPYIQAHVAADSTEMIKRGVTIVIQGPADTDPYVASP